MMPAFPPFLLSFFWFFGLSSGYGRDFDAGVHAVQIFSLAFVMFLSNIWLAVVVVSVHDASAPEVFVFFFVSPGSLLSQGDVGWNESGFLGQFLARFRLLHSCDPFACSGTRGTESEVTP